MRRGESMQEVDPNAFEIVSRGIEQEGSNLSGVSALCAWVERADVLSAGGPDEPRISQFQTQQIKSELSKGLRGAVGTLIKPEVHHE